MSKISAKLRQLEATVEAAKRDGIANDAILYAVQYGLEPRDDESHIEPAVQAIWEEAGFLAWRGVDSDAVIRAVFRGLHGREIPDGRGPLGIIREDDAGPLAICRMVAVKSERAWLVS